MELSFYLALFPAYVRDKARFTALAEAVLRQATDLAALAQRIAPGFSFACAEGMQLDALGTSVSVPRKEGWDDETYRGVLLRKLKRCNWDGRNETAGEYLAEGETLADLGGNAVSVHVPAGFPLPAQELLPVPPGVRAVSE